MSGTNCVFPQFGVARHHVGRCWDVQTTNSRNGCDLEKGHISDNSKVSSSGQKVERSAELENAYICELHFKKDDIEITSKLQNKFLFFCH